MHALQPVPLGDHEAPLQSYCLRNDGSTWLDYSIDLTALDQLRQDNYGHPILVLHEGKTSGV